MGQAAWEWHHCRWSKRMECPMPKPNDLSKSAVALDQDSTLISVIEMSQSNWLVAAIVPGLERHPLKKLDPEPEALGKAALALAAGGEECGSRDQAPHSCVRGRPRRLLAGALVAGPRHRGLCHSPEQRRCLARASSSKDGSARYQHAQACLSRLVTRRARPLPHGGDPNPCGRRCQTPEIASARTW